MKYINILLLKYALGEKHANNHKDPVAGRGPRTVTEPNRTWTVWGRDNWGRPVDPWSKDAQFKILIFVWMERHVLQDKDSQTMDRPDSTGILNEQTGGPNI